MQGVVSNKTMRGLKKSFAESVVDLHDSEVFGIGCNDLWDCLLKDYLILDVLEGYKKKCYDPCCDFTTLEYNSVFYFIIDKCVFDLEVGDVVNVSTQSNELSDIVDYTISEILQYPDIEQGLQDEITNQGYTLSAYVISLDGVSLTASATGEMFLATPKELTFDDRELDNEDICCLIEKIG